MKDGAQIYVIYFLIGFKMKKIIILFFTFSGNCTGFAQKPAGDIISDSIKQNMPLINQRDKNITGLKKEAPFIRLFPNPARNKVEIEINGFEPGFIQVMLIDNKGNKVRNDKRLVLGNKEIIVLMFSENPGLYILALKQNKTTVKTRLVIQ